MRELVPIAMACAIMAAVVFAVHGWSSPCPRSCAC